MSIPVQEPEDEELHFEPGAKAPACVREKAVFYYGSKFYNVRLANADERETIRRLVNCGMNEVWESDIISKNDAIAELFFLSALWAKKDYKQLQNDVRAAAANARLIAELANELAELLEGGFTKCSEVPEELVNFLSFEKFRDGDALNLTHLWDYNDDFWKSATLVPDILRKLAKIAKLYNPGIGKAWDKALATQKRSKPAIDYVRSLAAFLSEEIEMNSKIERLIRITANEVMGYSEDGGLSDEDVRKALTYKSKRSTPQ